MGKVCARCGDEWELEFYATCNRGEVVYTKNICKFCNYEARNYKRRKPNDINKLMSEWKR